jgi:putative copper export protein/mono/diheme cytochrome c family protein/peroxiredoxin
MPETLAVPVRWIYVLGMSLLVGLVGFRCLVARPTAREGGREAAAAFVALDAQLLVVATGTLVMTVLAGVLDLWRQVSVATGASLWKVDVGGFGAVLAHTRYGWVWLGREACLLLLAAWYVIQSRGPGQGSRLGSDVAAGALATVALLLGTAASHAASAQGWPVVAMTVDAAHLLATGVWSGRLLPLALSLGHLRGLPPRLAARVAAVGAQRFSRLAFLSVSALVATGVYNAWIQVGTIPGLVGTPYGRWLLLKIGLLLVVLVLAASNRYGLIPRLLAASAPRPGDDAPATVRRLRRQVLAELAVGSAILGVVAVLGLTTPARHVQPTWPFAYRLSWTALQTAPQIPPEVITGGVMVLFGALLILGAAFAPAWRAGYLAAGGVVALIAGLAVAVPALAIDAYPTTYRRPAVPYVTTSIATGAVLYREHCAGCHGSTGYGDGPAAAGLHPKPADLTAPHTGDHTAGDLFWWLSHGIPGSAMPGFADRLSETDRWDLINFIRALASGEQARMLSPVIASRPSVVAPDFAFGLPNGETRSLKDYRGRAVVLLVFFALPASRDRLSQLSRVYSAVRDLGAEIVAIPVGAGGHRSTARSDLAFPIAWDAGDDVVAAYGLFGRDLSADVPVAQGPPRHMEVLVDRQGYLRARWLPKGAPAWQDPARLLAAITQLVREPPRAPAPTEHVH